MKYKNKYVLEMKFTISLIDTSYCEAFSGRANTFKSEQISIQYDLIIYRHGTDHMKKKM